MELFGSLPAIYLVQVQAAPCRVFRPRRKDRIWWPSPSWVWYHTHPVPSSPTQKWPSPASIPPPAALPQPCTSLTPISGWSSGCGFSGVAQVSPSTLLVLWVLYGTFATRSGDHANKWSHGPLMLAEHIKRIGLCYQCFSISDFAPKWKEALCSSRFMQQSFCLQELSFHFRCYVMMLFRCYGDCLVNIVFVLF